MPSEVMCVLGIHASIMNQWYNHLPFSLWCGVALLTRRMRTLSRSLYTAQLLVVRA